MSTGPQFPMPRRPWTGKLDSAILMKQQPVLRVIASVILLLTVVAGLWGLDGTGLVALIADESGLLPALLITTVLYALLLSLPFVPGMELGWLIIGLFGKAGIFAAWAGTVAGLSLGFITAFLLRRHRYLAKLVTVRNALLNADPASLNWSRRLLHRGLQWHDRHPYYFVLLGLNIPGNWVIGGGGGIAWMSGVTPGLRFPYFVLVSTLATGVVPVALLVSL